MKYFIYCKNGVNANQSVRNHNIILWNNDIDRKWSQTRELKAMPSSETIKHHHVFGVDEIHYAD